MLAGLKLRRTSGQTARELAASAAQRLVTGGAADVEPLPAEVVAAYYRVRFGGAALDNQEMAKIEQALARISVAARRKPLTRKKQT